MFQLVGLLVSDEINLAQWQIEDFPNQYQVINIIT
jgi:hypothetical protein